MSADGARVDCTDARRSDGQQQWVTVTVFIPRHCTGCNMITLRGKIINLWNLERSISLSDVLECPGCFHTVHLLLFFDDGADTRSSTVSTSASFWWLVQPPPLWHVAVMPVHYVLCPPLPPSGQILLCLPPARVRWMQRATRTATDTAWTSPAWVTASSSTTRTLTGAQVMSSLPAVRTRRCKLKQPPGYMFRGVPPPTKQKCIANKAASKL